MKRNIASLLLVLVYIVILPHTVMAQEKEALEDSLVGVQIGSTTKKLNELYPGLYSHQTYARRSSL